MLTVVLSLYNHFGNFLLLNFCYLVFLISNFVYARSSFEDCVKIKQEFLNQLSFLQSYRNAYKI